MRCIRRITLKTLNISVDPDNLRFFLAILVALVLFISCNILITLLNAAGTEYPPFRPEIAVPGILLWILSLPIIGSYVDHLEDLEREKK